MPVALPQRSLSMEKAENHEHESEVQQVDRIPVQEVNAEAEEAPHVHAKTLILLVAIVAIYFVQVLHLAGNGLLASNITAVTGGADKSTWLVSCMAISAAGLGPPVSQAADYWGRKWFVVVFTLAGFVGCLISSRATSFGMLMGGQTIGCLSIGAQPLVHAIASEIIPRNFRSLAQAAVNTSSGLGGIVGILMGGALVRHTPEGFRPYFYITAGLYAAIAVIVAWLYHPPQRQLQLELNQRQKLARLDWIGYLLFVPGLVLFSYALTSSSGVYPWSSSKIIGPLVVGVVLLFMFAIYEWKGTKTGMLHHGLFSRGRNFFICLVIIFAEGISFFAANAYYGFEISVLYDQDLFHAGLDFTVAWWTAIVATIATGLYVSRTKTLRTPLVFAMVCFTAFNATMASLNPSTRWNGVGFAVFLGLGLGVALNTLVVAAQLSTPPELIAVASGLMIGMRSAGGTVGLSIYEAVFSNTLNKQLPLKVLAETIPLGFEPKYTGLLLGGLTTGNQTLLTEIPGITPQIIQAGGLGVKEAYTLGFRYVWIAAGAFAAFAAILSCFLVDPKKEFTRHIDAPIETEEELKREGIVEMLHHRGHHKSEV